MSNTELELMPANRPVATVAPPTGELNLQSITDKILTGELTNEKLQMIERLVAMDAERKFAAAFVALQAEMPAVKAMSVIPDNNGNVRSRFAAYEEIMEQVAPLLQKHGFTVTFSTDFKEGRIIKTCTLQHIGGHSRSNQFAVRVGSGPPRASEAQADGAASTYAKRFALCDCLNITIDKDTDAAVEGGMVTQDQAFELERRVAETNSNKQAFLKVANATSFAEIRAEKYDTLDSLLRRKENPKK